MSHFHYDPIVTPVIISGSWYSWTGFSYPMFGVITFVPQTWAVKQEQGTEPTTKLISHLKSRAAILVNLKLGATLWK
jgi:hypothetical protein